MSHRTLHPLYASRSVTWVREQGLVAQAQPHERVATSGWEQSPLFHMISRELPLLRRRLTGPDALLDFPVLEELRDQGLTDYLGFTVPFSSDGRPWAERDGMVGSWCTDRPGGFSDDEPECLRHIEPRLAIALKTRVREQITRNILAAYLGSDAGERVARGQIRRGDGDLLRAVIWYSDMRRSTVLGEQLGHAQFPEALNACFECSAGAVLAHGGEVLRFVGDAVLAIFPGGEDAAEPAARAADAARDACGRLAGRKRERARAGSEPLDFGLALHLGEVLFGNIGVPERLELSVIGPAVNRVARLEELTKTVGHRVVVSEEVAALLGEHTRPVGAFDLRDVGSPVVVWALTPPPH